MVSSCSGPWSPSTTRSHTHLQTCPPLRAWQLPSRVPEAPSWAFLFSPTEQTHGRVPPLQGGGESYKGRGPRLLPKTT